ncbi:hypothetical protein Hanom_Chr12g01145941 [Helianthus anomalus]
MLLQLHFQHYPHVDFQAHPCYRRYISCPQKWNRHYVPSTFMHNYISNIISKSGTCK